MIPHYLPAEVAVIDLPRLRLVDLFHDPAVVQVCIDRSHDSIGFWLRREDVARVIFDGQAERLAFYQTAAGVSAAVREAERVERRRAESTR